MTSLGSSWPCSAGSIQAESLPAPLTHEPSVQFPLSPQVGGLVELLPGLAHGGDGLRQGDCAYPFGSARRADDLAKNRRRGCCDALSNEEAARTSSLTEASADQLGQLRVVLRRRAAIHEEMLRPCLQGLALGEDAKPSGRRLRQ